MITNDGDIRGGGNTRARRGRPITQSVSVWSVAVEPGGVSPRGEDSKTDTLAYPSTVAVAELGNIYLSNAEMVPVVRYPPSHGFSKRHASSRNLI